ncbi:hypothetical protein L484_018522 [Morus notabilis]|uniref:Uncharacterized protein n=1 Tax=Morus notabilis TaxID=981085 RepID=W9S3Q3_9ROSA|nr:hypothetical protein L484_018522 [Morus notabilis]
MEEKEDERIDRPGISSSSVGRNEGPSSLLFRYLHSLFEMLEEELIHHETKLRELRTRAIRHLLDGEFERLKDLEPEVKKFNMCIEGHKDSVENLSKTLNDMELVFEKSGALSFAEFEEGYDEKMREKNPMKMEEAEEGRRIGNKNLMDMLQQLNQSDEGRNAFVALRTVAISIGIKLSCLLVEYFLLILQSEPDQMEAKIEEVTGTIQWENLEGNSVIIDLFVSVVEFIGKEMRNSTTKGSSAADQKEEMMKENHVWYGEREKDLLGIIFFEVLNLDFAFSRPIFLMRFPHKEILVKIGKNISKSFKLKLERIKLKMYEVKKLEFDQSVEDEDPETKELKERLEMEIKERWYELSFSNELVNKVESLHIK